MVFFLFCCLIVAGLVPACIAAPQHPNKASVRIFAVIVPPLPAASDDESSRHSHHRLSSSQSNQQQAKSIGRIVIPPPSAASATVIQSSPIFSALLQQVAPNSRTNQQYQQSAYSYQQPASSPGQFAVIQSAPNYLPLYQQPAQPVVLPASSTIVGQLPSGSIQVPTSSNQQTVILLSGASKSSPSLTCQEYKYMIPAELSQFYSCCGRHAFYWPSQTCSNGEISQAAISPQTPANGRAVVTCNSIQYFVSASFRSAYGCCGKMLYEIGASQCLETTTAAATTPTTTRRPSTPPQCPPLFLCCEAYSPVFNPDGQLQCCPSFGPYDPDDNICVLN